MKNKPLSVRQDEMWVLSADRRTARLNIPPVQLVGHAKPLNVHLDFDAKGVDEILKRLTALRSQMVPPPVWN